MIIQDVRLKPLLKAFKRAQWSKHIGREHEYFAFEIYYKHRFVGSQL